MRLIDADALQTALVAEYSGISGYKTREQFYKAIEIAHRQPAIDPERHGEWIQRRFGSSDVICSECNTLQTNHDSSYKSRFCPHCGARMDERGGA